MAKVSLARKKELREPDEFINMSNRAWSYARENKNTIMTVISVAVACIFLIAGYQIYSQFNNKKAFARYARDMEWYDQAKKDEKGAVPLEAVKEHADGFLKKYGGTPAGTLAKSTYAGIYFQEGDYSSASKLYESMLSDVGDPGLKNITQCALAHSYEAAGDTDKAVASYQGIISSSNEIKKDEALFHLGLIYEQRGDSEKSREYYGQIVKDFSTSMYADIAREKTNS